MKECDKRKSHISSKIHMIHISSDNVRHPVAKTLTTLNYTSLHFTTLTDTSLPPISPWSAAVAIVWEVRAEAEDKAEGLDIIMKHGQL